MTAPARHACAARLRHLADLQAFAEGFAHAAGLGPRVGLRLALVVEELFTNTVNHGHGGDCDAHVQVSLHIESDSVVLQYVDQAPAFDPLARVDAMRAERDAPSDERPVGHLGLLLLLEMAQEARYTRDAGANRLLLRLRASEG